MQTANSSTAASEQVLMISLAMIDESPMNPASRLRDIEELARSIQATGRIIEPLQVHFKEISKRYEVDDGHRRRAAALKLKWNEVPCIVREATQHSALIKLTTGLTKANLRPWEAAQLIAQALADKVKAKDVAAAAGRSEAWVSKFKKINLAAAKATKVTSGMKGQAAIEEPLAPNGTLFRDFTSVDELYEAAQLILNPAKAKAAGKPAAKTSQAESQDDNKDKTARDKLAAAIAEQFKLPVDNVEVVNAKDSEVAVIIAFSSLKSAAAAFKK